MHAATDVPTIEFLGFHFHDLDVAAAARQIAARDPDAPFAFVITPNAQHLVHMARGERVWLGNLAKAWLVLMDGRIVPLFAQLIFGRILPQASGSDVTVELLRHHIKPTDAVTVIGGGAPLEKALIEQFGFTNLAIHDPPMGFIRDPAAVEACLAFVAAHPARYIFLATGAPRSETLACLIMERCGVRGIGLCIGGSLLFATGLVKRAPLWMQKMGLEAFYRLGQNPRTHLRRIFIESLPVIWILLRARFGGPGLLPNTSGNRTAT